MVRIFTVICVLLVGMICGLIGGILAAANGSTLPVAVSKGAAAFGAASTLGLVVAAALGAFSGS